MNPADPPPYIFWGAASLLVFLMAWRGWRAGIVRQIAELLAMAAGAVCAYLFSPAVSITLGALPYPKPLLNLAAGAIIFVLTYLAVSITATILFKRTKQQGFPPVRWLYGIGGGVIGLAQGAVLVGVAVVAIRLTGIIIDSSGDQQALPGWVKVVVQLKRSFDETPALQFLRPLDPVPAKIYRLASKFGQLLRRPHGVERFFTSPQAFHMALNPKIQALSKDHTVAQDAGRGDYNSVARNPRLSAVLDDPEIARDFTHLDFEAAFDYALAPEPVNH